MKQNCQHEQGDRVPELGWVCGQCFKVLDQRPTRYGMRTRLGMKGRRQEIVWQAKIRTSAEGTTLSQFLKFMAKQYQRRAALGVHESYRMALENLRFLEEEFGCPHMIWNRSAAIDIADEEMSYWDHDEPEGNSA